MVYICSLKNTQMSQGKATIAQIIGPVVDIAFENGAKLPKIYDSI